jgi:hypothetical protein
VSTFPNHDFNMDEIRWEDDLGFDLPEFLREVAGGNSRHAEEWALLNRDNPYESKFVLRRGRMVLIYQHISFRAILRGWAFEDELGFRVLAIQIHPKKKAAKQAFRRCAA